MRPTWSHSKLSSYENCPRQYAYQYIERAQPGPPTIETVLGKLVHECLEWLHRRVDREKEVTLDDLLTRFEQAWKIRTSIPVRVVRGEPTEYEDKGLRMLENYWRAESPFDGDRTLALEWRCQVRLDDCVFNGLVDRVSETNGGTVVVTDYKSGSTLPHPDELEGRQAALYQRAAEERWPDKPVVLLWYFLAFGRRFEFTLTEEKLQEELDEAVSLASEIGRADEFPAKPSALCRWCAYQDQCPDARLT